MQTNRAIAPRCNIGPDEIARRRRSAIAATGATIVVASVLVLAHVPGPWRLVIWPLATAAAVTWLQVVRRFCVAFGSLGVENFGGLGSQVAVDPKIRQADRRRALQMVVEGSLIGLVVAIAISIVAI